MLTSLFPRVASGVALALVAAVALGATFVFLDAAGDADVGWAGLTIRATSFSILVLVALVVRPPVRVVRRDLGVLAAVEILDNGANASPAPSSPASWGRSWESSSSPGSAPALPDPNPSG